jgi:hypothetical protein
MSRVRNFVEPFALSYPFVPEMVELEPAMADVHGGVSIASANDADGLLFLMLAYLGQAKNDTVTLCVNDSEGPVTTIAAGEENDDTPVRLPAGLLQKGLNRIKFTIKRTSGNEESTKELVLYHRTSPPGDTPPVMNLSVSHTIIGPEEAKKFKVTAIYENAQWYDRIVTFINGVHFEYLLIPGSVSPLPPVPKSVVIDIPEAKLIEGGNDKTFEIKYRVVDYLTNSSGPPTWSDAVFVEVDLSETPPRLAIDQSLMPLSGVKLLQDYGWATKEVVGNVQLREASGGVPPYRYTSSDYSTASVTADGKVTGLKNGTTTISVMDSAGTTLTYSVQVSNVYKVKADNRLMSVPEAVNWIRSEGGESYDNFFVPSTVKAIPFNFVNLQTVLLPTPGSIPNGFFRWFGRGDGTAGSYAVFNSGTGAFYQGMSTSETRMAPIAFVKT